MLMAHRTRQILQDLEDVRENLLALSDDIWLSIDHNDADALEEGVAFKRTYNEKLASFDSIAAELSSLVQKFTAVQLQEAEQHGVGDSDRNARLIEELNRETPHLISEEFTFKRPHGFVLQEQAITGITNWRRLYELFCVRLLEIDGDLLRSLVEHPDYISKRGHHAFHPDPLHLRAACEIATDFYAEGNLSANSIRDQIMQLLDTFQIPHSELKIYLRQDRNAEG